MIPVTYSHIYVPVKQFLISYRALMDGRIGVAILSDMANGKSILLTNWRINWIGTCTLLRSSIDLFQADIKSCVNKKIREELENEWSHIKKDKYTHRIFWDFIRRERDLIIHEYNWSVYEKWLNKEGEVPTTGTTLLTMGHNEIHSILEMKEGPFAGQDSLDLLREGTTWVEDRICAAILRAGFSPDEERNVVTFAPRSARPIVAATLVTGIKD